MMSIRTGFSPEIPRKAFSAVDALEYDLNVAVPSELSTSFKFGVTVLNLIAVNPKRGTIPNSVAVQHTGRRLVIWRRERVAAMLSRRAIMAEPTQIALERRRFISIVVAFQLGSTIIIILMRMGAVRLVPKLRLQLARWGIWLEAQTSALTTILEFADEPGGRVRQLLFHSLGSRLSGLLCQQSEEKSAATDGNCCLQFSDSEAPEQ